jgi:hypothetical protein
MEELQFRISKELTNTLLVAYTTKEWAVTNLGRG